MSAVLRCYLGFWAILCIAGAATAANAASPWEEIEALEAGRPVIQNAAPVKPTPEKVPWGGWYAGLHAAAVVTPNTKYTGNGFEYLYDFDTGFGLGGSVGYAYDFGLRFESEVTYRVVQAESFKSLGVNNQGSGNLDSVSVMLNSWFDVKFLSFILGDWVPYFGAGAGVTHAWTNVGTRGLPLVEASDTAFAWQGGGGIAYRISEGLFFTVDYRFLRTFGSLSFDDPTYADPVKARYKLHNVIVGFRGMF